MDDYAVRLELAMEAERRRIAEFMHDEIGQSLTALRLALSLLKMALPDEAKGDLAEATEHCDRAIAQTRELMADVSPVVLYRFGLGAALSILAKQLGDQAGVTVQVAAGEPFRLDPAAEVLLFRAIEAVLRRAAAQDPAGSLAVVLQSDSADSEVQISLPGPAAVSDGWTRWLQGDESYGVRLKLSYLRGQAEVGLGLDDRTLIRITAPRSPKPDESEDD